jgi:hypothetical protein
MSAAKGDGMSRQVGCFAELVGGDLGFLRSTVDSDLGPAGHISGDSAFVKEMVS